MCVCVRACVCVCVCMRACVCVCVCVLQELEKAFMEAKAQVESGAVDCGESDEEPSREVSHWLPLSPHLMFVRISDFLG